jgi:hypothetical protein
MMLLRCFIDYYDAAKKYVKTVWASSIQILVDGSGRNVQDSYYNLRE